jgi:2-phosphosulfolactate phosphatase
MKTIDVCLTPELLHLHNIENSIVVVVDIFRATSCMTTAFANGVGSIIPVATIDECVAYQQQGYLAAAERDGKTPEGFDFDNSPFSYMVDKVKDATICVTTTNGTLYYKIKICGKSNGWVIPKPRRIGNLLERPTI